MPRPGSLPVYKNDPYKTCNSVDSLLPVQSECRPHYSSRLSAHSVRFLSNRIDIKTGRAVASLFCMGVKPGLTLSEKHRPRVRDFRFAP